jgi:hypothetical protein
MREYRKTFKPVRILVAGKYKTVNTVLGAAKALMKMPDGQGDANRRPLLVLDNFNDAVRTEDVRNAFIGAAVEAHLKVEHSACGRRLSPRRWRFVEVGCDGEGACESGRCHGELLSTVISLIYSRRQF